MCSPHVRVHGWWCEGYATMMHLKMKLIRTFSLEVLKQEDYSCVYLCLRAEPAPPWWEVVILFAGLGGGQQAQGWSDETWMVAELHWVPLGFTVTHLWIWGKKWIVKQLSLIISLNWQLFVVHSGPLLFWLAKESWRKLGANNKGKSNLLGKESEAFKKFMLLNKNKATNESHWLQKYFA